MTVSIRKFRIFVLVSNRIEYWSNYSIRFEISNIRTSLSDGVQSVASLSQLFHVGKLVRCRIVNITTKGAKKVVSLTINPKDVNKDVKTVKSGMVSR